MNQNKVLTNPLTCDTISEDISAKLSRADIQTIELKNKIKLLTSKESKEHLKTVLERI